MDSSGISIHALREEGDDRQAGSVIVGMISIHALREEGDPWLTLHTANFCHFYPRPPRGGRLLAKDELWDNILISIHALREEGDAAEWGLLACLS